MSAGRRVDVRGLEHRVPGGPVAGCWAGHQAVILESAGDAAASHGRLKTRRLQRSNPVLPSAEPD